MKDIHSAIFDNNLDLVEQHILCGTNLNNIKNDITPLGLAIKSNNIEVVQLLFEYGADPNCPIPDMSPLEVACEIGSIEIVRMLLSAGAYIEYELSFCPLPLFAAIVKGHLEVVKLLVREGARVNGYHSGMGEVPLCLAAKHYKIVSYLKPFTLEEHMLEFHRVDIDNFLEETLDSELPQLVIYSKQGDIENVKNILFSNHHLEYDITLDGGLSLYAAAKYGHYEVLKELIEAMPKVKSEVIRTAFAISSFKNSDLNHTLRINKDKVLSYLEGLNEKLA